jgi:hypothetical protein
MSPDRRAAALNAIRRALAAAPPAAAAPNAVTSFAVGVNAERAVLLRIIETHEDLNDPILARQSAIIRSIVTDLADDLVAHGRRTKRELPYADDADGGARLLRDEVLSALGSRARMLGPDPKP